MSDDKAILEALEAIRKEMEANRRELAAIRAAQAPKATIEQASLLLNCSPSRVFELITERLLVRASGVGNKSMVTTESIQKLQREGLPQSPRKPPKRAPEPANEVTDDDLDALVAK